MKKLYWIDYTTAGPMIGPWPFESVGFKTKFAIWEPNSDLHVPNHLDNIFMEIENWRTNIVAIWFFGITATEHPTDEPSELIQLCDRIRKSPNLKDINIMAFFRMKEISPEKKIEWEQRYDFYSLFPLRIIEYAKAAKKLAGEQPDDIEGAIYYLSTHGSWEIAERDTRGADQGSLQVDAIGKFVDVPRTRLLGVENAQYRWINNGIKPNVSTNIVFLVKDLSNWRNGLSETEMKELQDIANNSDSQLLLGVNSTLLEEATDSEIVKVINQATGSGGWQIFVTEHLWLENHWLAFYDNLLYEKDHLEQRTIEAIKIIRP